MAIKTKSFQKSKITAREVSEKADAPLEESLTYFELLADKALQEHLEGVTERIDWEDI